MDGVYVKAGFEREKAAVLVAIGALTALQVSTRRDAHAMGCPHGSANGHLGITYEMYGCRNVGCATFAEEHPVRTLLTVFSRWGEQYD